MACSDGKKTRNAALNAALKALQKLLRE